MGQSNAGKVLAYGPRNTINSALDYLHLNPAPSQQRLLDCQVLTSKVGLEHDHLDDGSHLLGLLSILCLYQHRGYETLHLSLA